MVNKNLLPLMHLGHPPAERGGYPGGRICGSVCSCDSFRPPRHHHHHHHRAGRRDRPPHHHPHLRLLLLLQTKKVSIFFIFLSLSSSGKIKRLKHV